MIPLGFTLTELRLTGPRVPDAVIAFTEGLNVISGPSDTGKTYAVQCIDFMLGASQPPKSIPEAQRYDRVLVVLRSRSDGHSMTMERSLRGGAFLLHREGHETLTLAESHKTGDSSTASDFYLRLSGLGDRTILTKKTTGKTRGLSFRDVVRLILIDEETVITERSPVLTGQYVTKTAESSVFRLLLSGVDDSSVHEHSGPSDSKLADKARAEVLGMLAERVRHRLRELDPQGSRESLAIELKSIEDAYEDAAETLAQDQASASDLEDKRKAVWSRLRETQSRLDVLSELQERLVLLRQQYASDIARLECIAEAGSRLGQLVEDACPVCGALAENQRHEYVLDDSVVAACQAEVRKTRALLADLASTLKANTLEIDGLREDADTAKIELGRVARDLVERLEPRIKNVLSAMQASQERRDACREALALHDRLSELAELPAAIEKTSASQKREGTSGAIGSSQAEEFSLIVQGLLAEWHFPGLERVTFDGGDQDIIVSGRSRASHGKGVRALLHAAFTLALMSYCRTSDLPHPGFVLIDSPLVVYREPDKDDCGFASDVKDSFYRSVAARFCEEQVVIVENEDPPSDIDRGANVIRFTGTAAGRSGFIPQMPRDA